MTNDMTVASGEVATPATPSSSDGNHGRQELRTPDGWIIRRAGDRISVMAPEATPGMTHVGQGKGRLEARLLYALADALLEGAAPAPSITDAEAFADRLEEIALHRDRITPGALREAATMIRQQARRPQSADQTNNAAAVAALETAVLDQAIAWWNLHRPIGWTTDQHRANPTVNVTGGYEQDHLAIAISNLLQLK